jgi:DNA-binding transcriptional ArsR family regulator
MPAGGNPDVKAAPLFAALGDATRLSIVAALCERGPQSITSLARGAPVSRQAVTRHLEVLEVAGLVAGRRRGREHIWQLETGRVDEARQWLDALSRRWEEALGRLKAYVEER